MPDERHHNVEDTVLKLFYVLLQQEFANHFYRKTTIENNPFSK